MLTTTDLKSVSSDNQVKKLLDSEDLMNEVYCFTAVASCIMEKNAESIPAIDEKRSPTFAICHQQIHEY